MRRDQMHPNLRDLLSLTSGSIVLLCVAVSAVSVAPGHAATQEQAEARRSAVELTDEATKLINEGANQQAIGLIDRALQADSSYARSHHALGLALGRLGEHARAADAFLRAVQLRPGWTEAHRMAALAAANAGRLEVAWEQAIRAQQSGLDMSSEIEALKDMSPPPEIWKCYWRRRALSSHRWIY